MKLITENLGKIIVALMVTSLLLFLLATIFVPGVREFTLNLFPSETNYIVNEVNEKSPVITCEKSSVSVAVGDTVDLFAGISAKSADGDNLISQLTSDFDLPVDKRTCVFVYLCNDNETKTLMSNIDTSFPGEWKVFYQLSDNNGSARLSVDYSVK